MLFKIGDANKTMHLITVDTKINGQFLNMEIDTGVGVSIISKTTHKKLLSEVPIHSASLYLKNYTGKNTLQL